MLTRDETAKESCSLVLESIHQVTSRRYLDYHIDDLSLWTNVYAKDLMQEHLKLALDEYGPIRLINTRLKNQPNADVGGIARTHQKSSFPTQIVLEMWLTHRNNLIIDFRNRNRHRSSNRYSSRTPHRKHLRLS